MSSRQSLLMRAANRLSRQAVLRRWRRTLAPLRGAARPECERSVLFCNLMTMQTNAKLESLMAGLLRLKGYRPVVLLQRPDRPIEQIFLAGSSDCRFVYLDDAVGRDDRSAAAREAEAILARTPSLQDLFDLEVDGYRIGRNVLSVVLRHFRVGRLDNFDEAHRRKTAETLVQSLTVKVFAERIVRDIAPDIAVFVERGYTPAGEVFDACLLHGVDVMQWCGAPQSDCLIYRRYNLNSRGEHPLTLSDGMWQRLLAMPWTDEDNRKIRNRIAANYVSGAWYNRQQLQEGKALTSPDDVRRKLQLDPARKTAIVFSHILYDATFFYGTSLFEDYEQWLIETVRAAIANPHLNWVVKVHPVNVWRARMDGVEPVQLEAQSIAKHLGALPPHVRLMPADTDINTFSLFDIADYGLTVRGTIGMEFPCFGIPVVAAGTGRYSGRGFTIDPATREEYSSLLARLQEIPRLDPESIRRARLHYYGALNLRPVPTQSFDYDFGTGAGQGVIARSDLILKRTADEGLLDSDDLGRLVKWLTQSKSPELLARDL
jgi:hypothetical protein